MAPTSVPRNRRGLTLNLDVFADMNDGEDTGRIYTPPPHIAARFYRSSDVRRKYSAASSRRNSISSAHSRSSRGGDSHFNGPQSKHVAWHFRRANFLADRQARLADRAAHVEKVRNRAAMAKAAPRHGMSAFEERVLAARVARQKNLDEIVASCAADVRRAKAIAETMKEKREQEAERLRLQMQERLAEADRRREELRKTNAARRGRSQSIVSRKAVEAVPQAKEQDSEMENDEARPPRLPLPPAVAVAVIQHTWRCYRRRKAIREFIDLGLSIDGVRATTFERVTELLSQDRVLLGTARCLRICGLNEGMPGSVNEMVAVRTFLSAFLILAHPTKVLGSSQPPQGMARQQEYSEQEQDLVTKARDLLICFENTLSRLTPSNAYTAPPGLLAAMPEAYATYHNAFVSWKARDSSAMIEMMILQFVELDAIWHTVKDGSDETVAETYRESIKQNQVMLMVRLKRLAGRERAKELIKNALEQAHRERAAKRPKGGDRKPRVTDQDEQEASRVMLEAAPPLSNPESSSRVTDSTAAAASGGSTSSVPPQQYLTSFGVNILPENRVVMHELAINKEYRIDAQDYKDQSSSYLAPLFRQMRAHIEHDNREAQFGFLVIMNDQIKSKLQRLVKPGHGMHHLILELLDAETAQRQFAMGSFSYERFFEAMSVLLPKLCAPVRDEEVRVVVDKLSSGHVVDRLEALIGFIDVMLSDYTNYLLSLSAPQLLAQGPGYEMRQFAADLERNVHDLSVATQAWKTARAKVYDEHAKRDPERINHPRSRPSADRIYAQMLINVFTCLAPPASAAALPEMLRLDFRRALRIGRLTAHIITAGTLLLQCKASLRRDTRRPWKTEAQRIMAVLNANDPLIPAHDGGSTGAAVDIDARVDTIVDGVVASLEAARLIPANTKAQLRAAANTVVREMLVIRATPSSSSSSSSSSLNPVASSFSPSQSSPSTTSAFAGPAEPSIQGPPRILLRRLRSHMLSRLTQASASEKVRQTRDAGEKLATLGLAEFVEAVREMVEELSRVGVVDREAHARWWEAIATAADVEEQGKPQ